MLDVMGHGVTCFNVLESSRTSWKMLGVQERTGCAGTFCMCWNVLYVLECSVCAGMLCMCWIVLVVLKRARRAGMFWMC
jgi:hypothetical protein